jgi:hypothetical protein
VTWGVAHAQMRTDVAALKTRADATAWLARVLALVAGVAVAFGDVLPAGRGLLFRDHVLVFRPRWAAVVEALQSWRWPDLTQANTGGVPLEHLLNATWTPATLLLLTGPFEVTYDLFVAAHVLWLGVGALLLARALGAERDQALLAAGVSALAGPVLACENLVVMIQCLAWTPWVGLGLRRLAARRDGLGVGGTALAVGFHLQGITPAVMTLDVLLAVALALHLRPNRRALLLTGTAGALGLAVAAVELVPALAALGGTERGQGFAYAMQSGWALHPAMLVELWCPSFWAPPEHPALNVPWATGQANDPPYFTTVYLGTALALAGAGGAARRVQRGLWLLAVLGLLLAMGEHTPLHRLLVSLPVLSGSRYAVKYTLLLAGCLAPLCALAVPVVAANPRRLVVAGLVQAGLLVATFFIVTSPEYAEAMQVYLQPLRNGVLFEGGDQPALVAALVAAQKSRLLVSLAAALALAGVGLSLPRLGSRGPAVIAVVVVMDLALAGAATIHGADLGARRLPDAPRAALTDADQRYWIEVPGGVNPKVAHRPGATRFDDMMRSLGQRGHHAEAARLWLDLNLDRQSLPAHVRAFSWISAAPRPAAYAMMARIGVARMVSPVPDLPLAATLSWPVEGEVPQHLYATSAPRPYVSAFTAWRAAPLETLTPAAYLGHMGDPAQAGVALVTRGLTASSTTAACPAPAVQWTRLGPGAVKARLDAACPTLVVLQEPAVPGWTALLDDAPAPLLEAEAGYAAALVPAGAHVVRFVFVGRSRGLALVSLATALVAMGLALTAARRRGLASALRGDRSAR